MERYIPDNNLAYPILLEIDGKYGGSGFYFYGTKHFYIVTAKHVLFKEDEGKRSTLKGKSLHVISYDQDSDNRVPIKMKIDLEKLLKNDYIKYHEDADVIVIAIASLRSLGDDKKDIDLLDGVSMNKKDANFVAVNEKMTKKYEDVLVSNEAFVFGYPNSLGTKDQIDYSRPLLRKGIIAGKNDGNKTIILDCPVFFGNSGGLVLEVEPVRPAGRRFWVIGIVSQFVPFQDELISKQYNQIVSRSMENSGYSIAVPIDTIFSLMK